MPYIITTKRQTADETARFYEVSALPLGLIVDPADPERIGDLVRRAARFWADRDTKPPMVRWRGKIDAVEVPWQSLARPHEVSRRAVATLEEARGVALNLWYGIESGDRDEHALSRRDACLHIPESGGTVGPLPDETLIEVKRVSWATLAQAAMFNADSSQAAMLDAYNAKQAS